MIEIHRQGVVDAPPEKVWQLVEDVSRLGEWLAFAERAELLEGSGAGRRQRIHGRWGSKRSEVDQRVVAWEPPRLLAWEHEQERLDGRPAPRFARSTRFQIALAPAGEGTRVELTSRQEPVSALRGLVMKLAATRQLARGMERSLERLAQAV